jgi:hypothetical protein
MRAASQAEPVVPGGPGRASDDGAAFELFVREAGPQLGRAFAAAYGFEDGRDATAEALVYAWENWHRLQHVANLPGYLFRVGQSRSRRKRQPVVFDVCGAAESTVSSPGCPGRWRRCRSGSGWPWCWCMATATRCARWPS